MGEYNLYIRKNDFDKNKYKHFCSRSCANGRIHNEETKEKISDSLKNNKNHKLKNKLLICKVCGEEYYRGDNNKSRVFCSDACKLEYKNNMVKYISKETLEKWSITGRKNIEIQKENRRSKNEILFFEKCNKYFDNVGNNECIFNGWDADVIIYDIKYAILWNGPWHHKQISKRISLKQIQNRDKIKIKEIINCGFTPYIIDDFGKYNKKFVEEKFNEFINYLK